jgi:two-component system alkaline phosphatase synthesis response regulator PhoP
MMIYYVEDDTNIRDLVIYTLNQSGFEAQGIENAEKFFAACQKQKPDMVLLDIMLPGDNGLTIIKRLRGDNKTFSVPVIMITAKSTEYDKVIGLDSGADDYIVKPFGMMELVARVRALQRRTAANSSPDVLTFGELTIDRAKRIVTVAGKRVDLTLKEFDLLFLLMKNKGTVFTRERLLEAIWDYSYDGGTRTVDVHIQTLRQKLGQCASMIETVRGVGYRFGGS